MRALVDVDRLHQLLRELGARATSPGAVYLTGGATALLHGWRASTVDVDLKLDPEPGGVFEAIAVLKERLDLNIELASPDLFLPTLDGWREASEWVGSFGSVEVFHYDYRAQVLSKLARGYARDLDDAEAMVKRELVSRASVHAAFVTIEPALVRFPRIDPTALRARVAEFVSANSEAP